MSKNMQSTGKKRSEEKESITLEQLNNGRIKFITQIITHDYVRCLLKNGAVYCGYIRKMDQNLTSFVLYYPYIEVFYKSPIHHTQPSLKNDIVVNFSDILKITTHKTVSRVEDEKEDTISKGILDSIFMGEPIPGSNMPFDDSERRKKAKSNQKNRKLESCFEFLDCKESDKGLDEEEYHKGGYDQFAENKEKFGVKSDFDISLYTTDVDKDEVPLELREAAARMEQEMKMAGSTNTHILEERGVTVNIGDEELYSKVHVTEATPRRERHRSSTKEEKVLSRSIMKHVPKEEKEVPSLNSPTKSTSSSSSSRHSTAKPYPRNSPSQSTQPTQSTQSTQSSQSSQSTQPTQPTQQPEVDHKANTKLNASAPEFVFKPANPTVVPVVANPMMANQFVPVFIPPNQMMVRGGMVPVQMVPQPIRPGQVPQQAMNMQAIPQQSQGNVQTISPQTVNGQQVIPNIPVYQVPYQMVRPVYPVNANPYVMQPQGYGVVTTQTSKAEK